MFRTNLPSFFVPFVGLVFPRIVFRAFFVFIERNEYSDKLA
uniref:Photosystem I reaction center subunit VIII n=1 Tax=Lepidodinium chlorophorum TaxID=107758 RepID=A0A0F7R568_LEPCH|nr:photosystem I subunit VIII [Lepidodinium chlorophorum]BAR72354.1 photosystem I subunit VIII [Lepidodinium chlorophorum]